MIEIHVLQHVPGGAVQPWTQCLEGGVVIINQKYVLTVALVHAIIRTRIILKNYIYIYYY